MGMMNKKLNLPKLQTIMKDFEKQNEKMEMTGEMMGDAIDDAMGVGWGVDKHDALPPWPLGNQALLLAGSLLPVPPQARAPQHAPQPCAQTPRACDVKALTSFDNGQADILALTCFASRVPAGG